MSASTATEVAPKAVALPIDGKAIADEIRAMGVSHVICIPDTNLKTVIADLRARPAMQHVVITGRGAPPALVEAADTVTDMTPVKHAFQQGIKAQRGVEM